LGKKQPRFNVDIIAVKKDQEEGKEESLYDIEIITE